MFLEKLFQICADRFIMKQKRRCFSPFLLSPSSRRAWIEIREADIGIAGGKGEAVLFIHGKPIKKLTGDNILDQFMDEIYKL